MISSTKPLVPESSPILVAALVAAVAKKDKEKFQKTPVDAMQTLLAE